METSLDDYGLLTSRKPDDEPWYDTRAILAYRKEHGLSAEEMTPELLKPFILKEQ